MHARIERHTLGFECRPEGSYRVFRRSRNIEGVGAILARKRKEYARPAHDDGVAELRRSRIPHGCKIPQAQWRARLRRHDGLP